MVTDKKRNVPGGPDMFPNNLFLVGIFDAFGSFGREILMLLVVRLM
jgi:hypothetical protein